MYNHHTDNIVRYITEAIVNSAKLEGKKEFINVIRIIEDNKRLGNGYHRQVNQISIDVYNYKQIVSIIEKLKTIFLDLSIEYVESKDLRGNVLDSAIRIKWD